MKTYHELMRDFAMERAVSNREAMRRVGLNAIKRMAQGKSRTVDDEWRHYNRCKDRMLSAYAWAAYHNTIDMVLKDENTNINTGQRS